MFAWADEKTEWWDEWRGSLDGRPTLWLKRLARAFGCRADLHKMVGLDDPECFHTHPAWSLRVILCGGYVEEVEGGILVEWKPGMIGIVPPSLCHRIHALRNGHESFSLWLRGPVVAKVFLRGAGWARQEQTHRARGTIITS